LFGVGIIRYFAVLCVYSGFLLCLLGEFCWRLREIVGKFGSFWRFSSFYGVLVVIWRILGVF